MRRGFLLPEIIRFGRACAAVSYSMKPQHIGESPSGGYNSLWGWGFEKLGLEPPTPSMLGATTSNGVSRLVLH
jgi:hypothetical protein